LSPGAVITPGSNVLVKSIKTGLFCRVVLVDGNKQILCDVEAADATPMIFTGSAFAYNV
jgi:hypothetical protein